jgi:hypothetical protein
MPARVHNDTMSDKPLKRPRDPAQLAKLMIDIASGEIEDREPTSGLGEKNAAAVELGRKGGLKGGKARAANLSSEQRSAIAKNAASKRWDK